MILLYKEHFPVIPDSVFIAPSVDIIGDVTLGEEVNIWFGSVVRGDMHSIRIGRRTNIQDNCTIHVTVDLHPVVIGSDVTIGHNAVIHGCTIGDQCLIGMGAIIMDGAQVGEGSLIAGGAVVTPGTRVPPGSLVAGIPAKVRRTVTAAETVEIIERAQHYIDLACEYMTAGNTQRPA